MSDPDHGVHPARALSVDHRVQYLTIVAAIVYADRQVADSELARLDDLCVALELAGEDRERVIRAARSPAETSIQAALVYFHKSDLRFALLSDIVTLAFADGKVSSSECEEIAEFARALGVSTAQAVLIGRYVEEVAQGRDEDTLSDELASGLAEAERHLPPRGLIRRLWRRLRG